MYAMNFGDYNWESAFFSFKMPFSVNSLVLEIEGGQDH